MFQLRFNTTEHLLHTNISAKNVNCNDICILNILKISVVKYMFYEGSALFEKKSCSYIQQYIVYMYLISYYTFHASSVKDYKQKRF